MSRVVSPTSMMSRIEIVPGGPPASAQVREAVREQIDRGELLPGDRLSTVRALAEDTGLAPNTVARAYRELESAGYVEGRGRAGTFVVDQPPAVFRDAEAALAEAADRFVARADQLGFDTEAATEAVRTAGRRAGR
jgi:DNA-binding transcriptional regulator YhcF (GntR family)